MRLRSIFQEALHQDACFVDDARFINLLGPNLIRYLSLPIEFDEEVVGKLLGLIASLSLHVNVVKEDALKIIFVIIVVVVIVIVLFLFLVVIGVVELIAIIIAVFS